MLVRLECLVQVSVTFALEMLTVSLWSCTVVQLPWGAEKAVSGLDTEGGGHGHRAVTKAVPHSQAHLWAQVVRPSPEATSNSRKRAAGLRPVSAQVW